MSDGRSVEWRRNTGNVGDRSLRCCSDAQGGERVLIGTHVESLGSDFSLVANELGISPSGLVIFASFPVAAVSSFFVSSGEFLVQQTYVESLPGAFCCSSNFASF